MKFEDKTLSLNDGESPPSDGENDGETDGQQQDDANSLRRNLAVNNNDINFLFNINF